MGELRYFPKGTASAAIVEVLSLQIAQQFLTCLVKTYTPRKDNPQRMTVTATGELAAVFADRTRTLLDLARVVDVNVRFPGAA